MTYNVRFRVAMPITAYDAMHGVVTKIAGAHTGLLAHLAWETAEGFEILEVWESRGDYGRFVAAVWPQVVEQLRMGDVPAPAAEELTLRGLVLSGDRAVLV